MLRFDKPGIGKRRSNGANEKLQDVILKAMAKKISWLEAAEIAGVTDRTMRRIRDRYQEFGYTGLFDQRRGKRSIHRIATTCHIRNVDTETLPATAIEKTY